MIIEYKDSEIRRKCNDDKYALKHYSPKIVNTLKILLVRLEAYKTFNSFYTIPGLKKYNAHPLKGGKKGIESLSLDKSVRMELIIETTKSEDGQDIIKILEVSNHYGD